MDSYSRLYPILSSLVDGNAYPEFVSELPNGQNPSVPYIVFTEIDTVPENVMDGFTGHEWTRVQIDVYHADILSCYELANQVIRAINKSIKPCEFMGRRRLPDPDFNLARQSLDVQFWASIFDQ